MRSTTRDPRVYLDDILAAITRIEAYTAEGKGVFLRDGKTQDAVIRQLSVIGEAAAKLPAAIRTTQPDIPWKAIVGMRNILIHEYSAVSIRGVWATVVRDLPVLRRAVESIRAAHPRHVTKWTDRKPAV
jgi:uncharacterized protein with HEPN domain